MAQGSRSPAARRLFAFFLAVSATLSHAQLPTFSSIFVCAPGLTVFVAPTTASSPAIVYSGDQAAIAQLNATVSNGVLSLIWAGTSSVTTTQPLIANITIPSAAIAQQLQVSAANNAQVLLAPNLTTSALTLSASNDGVVAGNLSSPVSSVTITATNDGGVALGGSGATVSVSSSNDGEVLLFNATGNVQGSASNDATVVVFPAAGASVSISGTAANDAVIYCPGCTANVQTANGATVTTTASSASPLYGSSPILSCFSVPAYNGISKCSTNVISISSGRKMLQVVEIQTGSNDTINNFGAGSTVTSVSSSFDTVACKSGPTQAVF